MANMKDLANRLNKYADKLEAAPSEVAARVSIELVKELTDRTPVDTSKAISNWILSLDEPVLIEIDAHKEGSFGSSRSTSIEETVRFAESKVKDKEPEQPIYVSNSASYIRRLDEGSSSQAPAGIVAISVHVVRKKIKAIFKEVMKDGR